MPFYRGIAQADVVSSINEALALLETHSPGPECQAYIDGLRKADPASGQSKLGAIAAAADDVALATAIRASGATYLFARSYDVLEYHALNNTGGKGLGILKALNAWGATGGAMTMEYNKYDAEFDGFLAKHRIRNFFNKAAGLVTGRWQQLRSAATGPMRRYGLVIDALTDGSLNWTDKGIEPIRMEVEKTLSPFYDTDEVGMTGIGGILSFTVRKFEKGDPMGIVFETTPRAAEAVAKAMPGYKVMDEEGRVIAPHAPKATPGTAPKP